MAKISKCSKSTVHKPNIVCRGISYQGTIRTNIAKNI